MLYLVFSVTFFFQLTDDAYVSSILLLNTSSVLISSVLISLSYFLIFYLCVDATVVFLHCLDR